MEGHLSTRGSTSSSYGNVLVGGNAHAHFGDNIQNVNITFGKAATVDAKISQPKITW